MIVRGPLRHPAFAAYQGIRLGSVLAVQMMSVAVGWHVYLRTEDPMSLGLVGLAQFAPLFLLSPITGDVADRFDRKHVLTVCHAIVMLCAGALAYLTTRDDLGTAPIYGVLTLFGAARAFAGPAGQAILPALVPADELPQGIAMGSMTFQIGTIVGPTIAGLVIDAASGTAVLLICAALELGVVVLLVLLRYRPEARETQGSSWKRLTAGLRYVRDHRVILGAISLDLFAVLLGGAVVLMPIYARAILHVDEWGLGLLRSAPAVGAGLVALALTLRPIRRHAGKAMLVCVGIFGLATIVFGLSTSFPLSLAALVVLGAADMVSVVIRQTVVQIATPPEMRGRVAAVNMVFIGASNELGDLESGATAAWWGTVPAVVVGGVGTLIVTLIYWAFFRELRDVDRLEEDRK